MSNLINQMYMKAIKFIEQRAKLSNEITKYWDIISKQNVIPKALKRSHDLKKLYTEINCLADQRALVKLKLIAINMGYKRFKDIPESINQYDVFKLCELQEIKVKLQRIPTLNPVIKAKKGKKALRATRLLVASATTNTNGEDCSSPFVFIGDCGYHMFPQMLFQSPRAAPVASPSKSSSPD